MGRPQELSEAERQRLIAEGYKPVEVWVRASDDEAYRAEAKRQAQAAASADEEDRVDEWIAAVSAGTWDDV